MKKFRMGLDETLLHNKKYFRIHNNFYYLHHADEKYDIKTFPETAFFMEVF